MNILFVMEPCSNRGSIHAVANYIRMGQTGGHRIAMFGPPQPGLPESWYATDLAAFDRLIFLYESNLAYLRRLQEVALLGAFPRRRRFVFDADGMYNPWTRLEGYDRNYPDAGRWARWTGYFDGLADCVLQPTLRPPPRPNVTPLPFYAFNPDLCLAPEQAPTKRFDILLVGHNWWRWRQVAGELLPAFASVRDQVGEIGFIGLWWDRVPDFARTYHVEDAYQVDSERLRSLRIQVEDAVPFGDVIRTMSLARVNIMTQRPLLRHFEHLTHKYFEVFCADTIPLLMIDPDFAERIYGPAGRELCLFDRIGEKLLDAVHHPEKYRPLVAQVRRHLAARHCYAKRFRELLAVLEVSGAAKEVGP